MKPFVIILFVLTFASTYTISAQNLETSPNTVSFKKSGKPRHINRFADKGYFGFAEFNFALGETYTIQYDGSSSESNRIKSYGLDIVNGYRTSPWFAIGIGIGVRYYDCEDLLIPYYIHLRTDILDRRVTPFFALNIGGRRPTQHRSRCISVTILRRHCRFQTVNRIRLVANRFVNAMCAIFRPLFGKSRTLSYFCDTLV